MLFDLFLSILGILLTITIIVGFHEAAHFLVARLLGIKVLRFSIGFGKPLYSWTDKKGTEYVIAPIPLGGYVKVLDETEGPVADHEKHLAYNRQSLIKRAAVVIAGPLSNILLAIVLYWIIFMVGFDTPKPLIGIVTPGSIAAQAGLKPLQEITAVDGHPTHGWSGVNLRLIGHTGDQDFTEFSVMPYNPAKPEQIAASSNHALNLSHWQMNELNPDPLMSLGITPYMPDVPLIIGKIQADSPASQSELRQNDKILAIDGKPIKNWDQVLTALEKLADKPVDFSVQRGGKPLHFVVQMGHKRDLFFRQHGYLGIGPDYVMPQNLMNHIHYGFFGAAVHASEEVWQLCSLNLLLFGKLITHKLSPQSLGGPITIFESAASAFKYGVLTYLGFLAFLNVALGVINIFPIPGLDGGHLLFQAIEGIMRRPVSLRVQTICYKLGFLFLMLLIVQALTNDVMRIWS